MFMKKYSTKIGKITICEEDGYITNISFENEDGQEYTKEAKEIETDLIKEAIKQIRSYLGGDLKILDFPIKMKGTEFQKSVWSELMKVPYGETATYKEIAKKVGNEKASRAVGNANNKNNLPIIIPCHRIIGTNGKLVGFAGGLNIKEMLLDIELKNK